MHMSADAAKREPPRLAAKHWLEFQGKQTLMSNFFTKRSAEPSPPTAPTNGLCTLATAFDALDTQSLPSSVEELPASEVSQPSSSSQLDTEPSPSSSSKTLTSSQASSKLPQESHDSRKRPRTDTSGASAGVSKQKKLKAGQSKLSSFFTKPTTATPAAPSKIEMALPDSDRAPGSSSPDIIDLCEEDREEVPSPMSGLPTITSEIRLPPDSPSSGQSQGKESEKNGKACGGTASWSALFTPIPPPLCTVHQEPTKEWRVNKPGPNKGKTFYLCARPVGPGYDKGRSERLREEVDHQYKCNFFMWAKEARREAAHASAVGTRTKS